MGQSTQRQNSTTSPWGPTQGALEGAIPRVEQQFQQDQSNPLVGQAQGYLGRAIGGEFLNPSTNPHLGALTSSITDPIQAQLSAQYGRAGRGNSADAARGISQGMTAGLAGPLFQQYNQERGMQQQAAGMAPTLQAAGGLSVDQMLERLGLLGRMGGQQQGTTTSSPSALQTIAGVGLTAAGLMTGNPFLAAGGMGRLGPGGNANLFGIPTLT